MSYKPPKQTIEDNDLQNTPSSDAIFESLKLKLDEPTLAGSSGQLLQLDGYLAGEPIVSWANPPVSGANTSLSNLTAPTALNQPLISPTGNTPAYAFPGFSSGTFGIYGNSTQANSQSVKIGRSSNLGVGTATITFFDNDVSFDVSSNDSNLRVSSTSDNTQLNIRSKFIEFATGLSTDVSIQAHDGSNTLAIKTKGIGDFSAQTRLVINDNKNIGINTLLPTEKLEVDGNIKITNGDLVLEPSGGGLKIEQVSDATAGITAFFPTGNPNTVTVSTDKVRDYSRIFLTTMSNPSGHNPVLYVESINSGSDFTIRAYDNNFDGQASWFFINVPAFDSDAIAFYTAAGITSDNEQLAIDTLVKGLKRNNLWDKMTAIYPLVGSTSTSHSYNLRNPSQYQLSYLNPGALHTFDGFTLNNLNEAADTGIVPSVDMFTALNSMHMSAYLKVDTVSENVMGAFNNLPPASRTFISPKISNQFRVGINGQGTLGLATNTDAKGFYCVSRTAVSYSQLFKNGTAVAGPSPVPSTRLNDVSLYLGHANSDGPPPPGSIGQTYAFFSIGSGLQASEVALLYTIVQEFQTVLLRQV